MSKRKVRLVIICEDKQQGCFAGNFLHNMGWRKEDHKLRIKISPSGRGSGEQWVRERYIKELKNYRKGHVDYVFLAIVDGDKLGVSGRIAQFEKMRMEKGNAMRKNTESVAIFVPTRNIETWIHYLEGNQVDETSEYFKLRYESECKPAVDKLVDYCKGRGLPDDAPGSLQAACDEYRMRLQR